MRKPRKKEIVTRTYQRTSPIEPIELASPPIPKEGTEEGWEMGDIDDALSLLEPARMYHDILLAPGQVR